MSTATDYSDAWVCVDCYFAHHYGVTEHDGRFYAGESDTPADREPLSRLSGDIGDATCSNHLIASHHDDDGDEVSDPCPHCGGIGWENGIDDFSMSSCHGCGSSLGGTRYRLAVMS